MRFGWWTRRTWEPEREKIIKAQKEAYEKAYLEQQQKDKAQRQKEVWAKRMADGKHGIGWKGDNIIDQAGYVRVYRPGHQRADKMGRVPLHITVAEEKYGRCPTREEAVHHIDFDKTNNEPDNLVILSSKEHIKLHWSAYEILKMLFNRGLFEYDEENNKYTPTRFIDCYLKIGEKSDITGNS